MIFTLGFSVVSMPKNVFRADVQQHPPTDNAILLLRLYLVDPVPQHILTLKRETFQEYIKFSDESSLQEYQLGAYEYFKSIQNLCLSRKVLALFLSRHRQASKKMVAKYSNKHIAHRNNSYFNKPIVLLRKQLLSERMKNPKLSTQQAQDSHT